jgi:hypothetical protein
MARYEHDLWAHMDMGFARGLVKARNGSFARNIPDFAHWAGLIVSRIEQANRD